jgi:acyl-CoA synthetase (AMP-forming)/AMP-acid ligase II
MQSLTQIIRQHAFDKTNELAYVFLKQGVEADSITFKELFDKSCYLAQKLHTEYKQGDRILLAYSPGIDFIISFCACLMANMVAIPCIPPRSQREIEKFLKIIGDSKCSSVLMDRILAVQMRKNKWEEHISALFAFTDRKESGEYDTLNIALPSSSLDDLAVIQYTSGSTGEPKGVMLSHYNLVCNQECIKQAFGHHSSTAVVSWLPHYHDMGLIGNILQPLYLGRPSILMSPNDFIQKPILWLEAISKYKATTSGAPCFAYDLCVQKITDEQIKALDLSSWEVAYIGSDPVSNDVLSEFELRFKNSGFNADAFLPCYGLAESTLLVTAKKGKRKIYNGERALVSNGKPFGVNLKIVDPGSFIELEDEKIGEIWISGASVTKGYWKKKEINREIFEARIANDSENFLRTGDLGFMKDGELYITGRLKALIKIRGKNYFSEDIELSLQKELPMLKRYGGAAFAIQENFTEKLIVVHEIEKKYFDKINYGQLKEQISEIVVKNYRILPADIVLVYEWLIPRTSSGKIIRDKCKEKYLANELKVLKSCVNQQLTTNN